MNLSRNVCKKKLPVCHLAENEFRVFWALFFSLGISILHASFVFKNKVVFNLYRHTDVEENSQNVPRNSEMLRLGSVYSTDLLVVIFDIVPGAGGRNFHFALQTCLIITLFLPWVLGTLL